MTDWQSIESAPMDGTPILVWLEAPMLRSRYQIAIFRPNVSIIGGVFAFDAPKPLGWQPLPEPPAG